LTPIAQGLIERSAERNRIEDEEASALHVAVLKDNEEIARYARES
jgi:hypothetical protein